VLDFGYRERAERGLVQLRLGKRVWWKLLHELIPEDRPARLEAKRGFALRCPLGLAARRSR
jgi:hypothetical protein